MSACRRTQLGRPADFPAPSRRRLRPIGSFRSRPETLQNVLMQRLTVCLSQAGFSPARSLPSLRACRAGALGHQKRAPEPRIHRKSTMAAAAASGERPVRSAAAAAACAACMFLEQAQWITFQDTPLTDGTPGACRSAGAELKAAVRAGRPLFGLFLNSASPLAAEQLATLPYDYMLVRVHVCAADAGAMRGACRVKAMTRAAAEAPAAAASQPAPACLAPPPSPPVCAAQVDIQHAPTDYRHLGEMITAVNAAGKPALVRVEGPHDRGGIQQVSRAHAAGLPNLQSMHHAALDPDARASSCLPSLLPGRYL